MVLGAAWTDAVAANATRSSENRMFMSCRRDFHRLHHVAHVACRLPQRFHRLALARSVPRAHAQVVHAGRRHEAEGELAERVATEVGAEGCAAPALAAVAGIRDLADALPAVERDAPH